MAERQGPEPDSFDLSVVVPNYNDKDSVVPFLDQIEAELSSHLELNWEVIIVDDGSTDGSVAALETYCIERDRFTVLPLVRNFGQQTALFVGLQKATGRVVVTIDGDGQYPAAVIHQLYDAVNAGSDLASGVRMGRKDTFKERFTSRIGGFLIKRLLGFEIEDFGAVKAFSRPLVNRIVGVQFGTPDVYPAALSWGPTLAEIPFNHRDREFGTSKWSLTKRLKLYFDLYFKYGDDRFGGIFKAGGAIMVGSAAITAIWLLYKFIFGHEASVLVIGTFGALFFILGLQFMLWSLIASGLKQILRSRGVDSAYMIREPSSTSTAAAVAEAAAE